ncbi:Cyn operon transcriptional activator [Thalassovita gelatinovora]|uniref:Cyn operon transcriptional activator n=1 Tax=Thalassovita gelatinovora TaxID=53501 RepID=A0A0P1F9Q0_THAGE|nr:LysR family transcriptional regulator [Thalassovita gelatinovora]QIZ81192.1 LysR family transcriptional regulator [Thalassovita gelatinovora]CUH64737.1 Cyn operon transcriptional activator [Thalassovita gelatinovora]SEP92837.1 transcriptional regulator, LysR family [Thalassovita gelatinovora]
MNIKSLRLFRSIVATGSLSQAANRLNLSPSAASRLITQLEAQISLTLFSRDKRNLELSDEGVQFYQQISNTLDGIDEIPEIARDIRTRTRTWVSVVTAAPLANGLLVPTIAKLRNQGVDLHCTVHVESRFEIESKVAVRGYNIGLISLPLENEIIPLDVMPLLRSRLCLLMPIDHPLANEAEINPRMLDGVPMVTLATGQRWRSRLDEVMGKAGLRPEIAFETGSTLVTVEMVRQGLGLTLIDPVMMSPAAMNGLAMRPIGTDEWLTYASVHAKGPRAELSEVILDGMCAHIEARRDAEHTVRDLIYLI